MVSAMLHVVSKRRIMFLIFVAISLSSGSVDSERGESI